MKILKHKYSLLLAAVAVGFGLPAAGQDADYFSQSYLRHQNYVYKDHIRTVEMYREGWKLSPPVINLNSNQKLILSFDDLNADVKNYHYTIIHCNAMWEPSELGKPEYIRGFYEDEITDYAFSFNTIAPYTNYMLVYPTGYLQHTRAGNYILKVFTDEEADSNVVLTRRFMVTSQKVSISGKVVPPVNIDRRSTHQQLAFTINTGNYYISDPERDLKVMILQNWRYDNAAYNVPPRQISGNKLEYNFMEQLIFEGGNEFRAFDTKDLRYQSEQVALIDYRHDGHHIYLHPAKRRTFSQFVRDDDLNGRFFIEKTDAASSETEADYAWVHFTLPYPHPMVNGNMYIMGALTGWQFTDEARLNYDYENRLYEATLFLKQGYYNYLYGFLEDGVEAADVSLVEGSHWDTENEYIILVYYREPGTYYDQLIGIEYIVSHRP
jgi:hypothetical protein